MAAYPGSNRFPTQTMCDNDTNTSPAEHGWVRCERGQALVEYALILMFVSITAIALTPVGASVVARLAEITVAL
jgi:Flp pilus assembly pilin Flp